MKSCPFLESISKSSPGSQQKGCPLGFDRASPGSSCKREASQQAPVMACPLGFGSAAPSGPRMSNLHCCMCKTFMHMPVRCNPCSHIFCRFCIAPVHDCPVCGQDIEGLVPDEDTQGMVDRFLAAHASDGAGLLEPQDLQQLSEIVGGACTSTSIFFYRLGLQAMAGGNIEAALHRLEMCKRELHLTIDRQLHGACPDQQGLQGQQQYEQQPQEQQQQQQQQGQQQYEQQQQGQQQQQQQQQRQQQQEPQQQQQQEQQQHKQQHQEQQQQRQLEQQQHEPLLFPSHSPAQPTPAISQQGETCPIAHAPAHTHRCPPEAPASGTAQSFPAVHAPPQPTDTSVNAAPHPARCPFAARSSPGAQQAQHPASCLQGQTSAQVQAIPHTQTNPHTQTSPDTQTCPTLSPCPFSSDVRHSPAQQHLPQGTQQFSFSPAGMPRDLACQLGAVWGTQADCCKRLREFHQAASMYQASIECLRHAAESGDTEAAHALSVSFNKLGDLHFINQDLPAAVGAYKQGLGVRRQLLAAAAAQLADQHQLYQHRQQHAETKHQIQVQPDDQADTKQQGRAQQGTCHADNASVPSVSDDSLEHHLHQLTDGHASKALDVVASLLKLADACSALGAPHGEQQALQAEARDLVQSTGSLPPFYPSSYTPSPSNSARRLQLMQVLEALSRSEPNLP